MTFEEFFKEVKERFMDADVSQVTEHLAFQFNITGEAEGIFYAEVKDGTLSVEPYEYYDRDAIFICSADTLRKIADGKTDPVKAFTFGKLKVQGSIEKALKLKSLFDTKKKK
ncbi:MAG: SCP2 sterol-binding domain-containing protein [Lachnospiraceae bacterium]|nr:SCP2 sterol-binding domain-containing protein [Lachnospiraceae bacterium]